MNHRIVRTALGAATIGALSLLSTAASAQIYGQVQVGVQAPVYAQPQPVYVQQQQPVYVQQQPVYVQQQQPVYVQRRGPRVGRFRVGFDLGGGYLFAGDLRGPSITGSLRLGWQLNDQLAFYIQEDLPIGFASGNVGGFSYSGAAVVLGTGFMGEWHFNDLFSVALGPSADYAAGAICSSDSSGGSSCIGAGGTFFGIQARVSLTLVAASAGQDTRRYGFRIGVSSHTSFIGSTTFQFVDLHLGYEWY